MGEHKKTLYLLFIAIVIASYVFAFLPYKRSPEEIKQEIIRQTEALARYGKIDAENRKSKVLHEDFMNEVREFARQAGLIPDVQQEVVRIASAVGMDLGQIEALPNIRKGAIDISSFSVQATGEYRQILRLLDEVSLLPRLVNVRKLNLESFSNGSRENSKGILKMSLVLEYYVGAAAPENPPAR